MSISLAQNTPPPPTFTPTPYSLNTQSPASPEPSVPPVPHGIPTPTYTEPEMPCKPEFPRTEIKDKKKIAKLTRQLKGTWQYTLITYSSRCAEGPYKLKTSTDAGGGELLKVTFQDNGFCTNYFEDPVNGGPWCEKPIPFYTDETFGDLRGGQAFMKLNKSTLEFYRNLGFSLYEKYILKKASKAKR